MKKLDQVELNALGFLAQVGEFNLPDDPRTSPKASAIARVMDSLVRKKFALVVGVTEDSPPRPRYGITEEGRNRAPLAN
jgi:DNA-binding PadR family transcriptional regulator